GEDVVVYAVDGKALCRHGGAGRAARSLAWSPDGASLAIGCPRELLLWNVVDDTSRSIPAPTSMGQIDWSPDGRRIVACDNSGSRALYVMTVDSAETRTLTVPYGVDRVAWRPDGQQLAYLTSGGEGAILDAATLETVTPFGSLRGYGLRFAWKPDSTLFAFSGPPGVVIVQRPDGERIASFSGSAASVRELAWHPTEPRLVSLDDVGTVREWDVERDARYLDDTRPSSPTEALAWSPDGRWLATARTGIGLRVWDAESHRPIASLPQTSALHTDIAWSPCGRFIAAAESGGRTRIWHVESARELTTFDAHGMLAWDPTGRRLAVLGSSALTVWDVGERRCIDSRVVDDSKPLAQSRSPIAWRPGHEELAFVSHSGSIARFDLSEGVLETPFVHEAEVTDLAWSPDGRRIVTACESGSLTVWELGRATPALSLRGHTRWPVSVTWSPDGSRIASGGEDHAVRVWDANDGTPLVEFGDHPSSIRVVRWSPDGSRIASSDASGRTRIWSARPGYRLSRVVVPSPEVATPAPTIGERSLDARIFELLGRRDQAAPIWTELEHALEGDGDRQRSLARLREDDASRDRWSENGPQTLRAKSSRVKSLTDHSWVTAGADGTGEEFVVSLDVPAVAVRALRLEALRDVRLPSGGPGWGDEGGFEVTEVAVFTVVNDEIVPPTPIAIARCFTDPESGATVDGGRVVGWRGRRATRDEALYMALTDVGEREASRTIEMRIRCAAKLPLGRFRLTPTNERNAFDLERQD
ncbi:MAG: PD40 domain-containing protein, partial [Planctomycetes bacterium]|nr:PD40 domain-containing protein [Planctomycetota bacterium]